MQKSDFEKSVIKISIIIGWLIVKNTPMKMLNDYNGDIK